MLRSASLLIAIMLGGCAMLPPTPEPARPAQHETAPFALNGRISVKYNGSRESAGLRWIHATHSDEILLLTPLGQTAARIYSDASRTTLDEGKNHYENENAEQLMQQVLGWHLPLKGMHRWVLGLTHPESEAQVERTDKGQIAVLRQEGWEVRYLSFQGDSPDSLPKRLRLTRKGLEVQLLIDEWDWNPQ